MRTIIAGSRGLGRREVEAALAICGWTPNVVISGTAQGVDRSGEEWARHRGIPIERYPADWSKGRSAGLVRNERMAKVAEALVAVWDGQSNGTRHMILAAKTSGLRVYVWTPKEPPRD